MLKKLKCAIKLTYMITKYVLKPQRNFLTAGNKVKVVVMLRGREMQHNHLAMELIQKFLAEFEEDTIVLEKKPAQEGKNVVMVIAPQGSK